MKCGICGKEIKKGEGCYQIRYGYLVEDEFVGEDFIVEEDYMYVHPECLPL